MARGLERAQEKNATEFQVKEVIVGYSKAPGGVFWMQLVVGLFFVFLGVLGILPQYEEGFFSLTSGGGLQVVEIVIGVIEVAIGAILVLGLFQFLSLRLLASVTFWAWVFWLARLVLSQVVIKLGLVGGVIVLTNMTFTWWLETLLMLIVAANLWALHRRYAGG